MGWLEEGIKKAREGWHNSLWSTPNDGPPRVEIPWVIKDYAKIDNQLLDDYRNDPQYFAHPAFGPTKGTSVATIGGGLLNKVSDNPYLDRLATIPQTAFVGAGELAYQLGTDGLEGKWEKALADAFEQTAGYAISRWRGDNLKTSDDIWKAGIASEKTLENFKKPLYEYGSNLANLYNNYTNTPDIAVDRRGRPINPYIQQNTNLFNSSALTGTQDLIRAEAEAKAQAEAEAKAQAVAQMGSGLTGLNTMHTSGPTTVIKKAPVPTDIWNTVPATHPAVVNAGGGMNIPPPVHIPNIPEQIKQNQESARRMQAKAQAQAQAQAQAKAQAAKAKKAADAAKAKKAADAAKAKKAADAAKAKKARDKAAAIKREQDRQKRERDVAAAKAKKARDKAAKDEKARIAKIKSDGMGSGMDDGWAGGSSGGGSSSGGSSGGGFSDGNIWI